MSTGSAVREHRTTAPDGADTTELTPPTVSPPAPPDQPREELRLGRRIAAVAALALVVVVYVVHAALPVTAFTLPYDQSVQVRSLVPEGWAFFTKSPRSPDPTVYGALAAGGWRRLSVDPQANPGSLMGLDRLARAQGTEVAIVTAQVPREAWTACDRPPTQCLSGLRPAATVVNRSTHRTICGDVGLTIQEVLPWAWHGLSTVMPSQVVRVVVTC
jgi:antimicrobial peptide system SdpA family protein